MRTYINSTCLGKTVCMYVYVYSCTFMQIYTYMYTSDTRACGGAFPNDNYIKLHTHTHIYIHIQIYTHMHKSDTKACGGAFPSDNYI